jgi:hypothetical protein
VTPSSTPRAPSSYSSLSPVTLDFPSSLGPPTPALSPFSSQNNSSNLNVSEANKRTTKIEIEKRILIEDELQRCKLRMQEMEKEHQMMLDSVTESVAEKIRDLENRLVEVEAARKTTEGVLSENLRQVQKDLQTYQENARNAENRNKELSTTNNDLVRENAKLREQDTLRTVSELAKHRKETDALKKQLADVKDKHAKSDERIRDLESKLCLATVHLETRDNEFEALKKTDEMRVTQISRLTSSNDTLEMQNSESMLTVTRHLQTIERLEQELREQRSIVEDREKESTPSLSAQDVPPRTAVRSPRFDDIRQMEDLRRIQEAFYPGSEFSTLEERQVAFRKVFTVEVHIYDYLQSLYRHVHANTYDQEDVEYLRFCRSLYLVSFFFLKKMFFFGFYFLCSFCLFIYFFYLFIYLFFCSFCSLLNFFFLTSNQVSQRRNGCQQKTPRQKQRKRRFQRRL